MKISDSQKDALTELVNIGVGHAASTLNSLINHKIHLVVPEIELLDMHDIQHHPELSTQTAVSSVGMRFEGAFNGNASLMFPLPSAKLLVALLSDTTPASDDLDDAHAGTLAEVGNILLNGVMGSIGNMLSAQLHYAVPIFNESPLSKLLPQSTNDSLIMAKAHFNVDGLEIEGKILLFFEIDSLQTLIHTIDWELTA